MLKKLGCHLYPWNHLLVDKGFFSSEMDAVLSWISKQGFSGIETGARFIPFGREEEVKNLLLSKGLQISGIHIGAPIFEENSLTKLEEVYSEIKRIKHTGTSQIILSGMRKMNISKEEALFAAKVLDTIGEACRAEGLSLLYHNHDFEFVDHQLVQNILVKETTPEYVSFALDLGWIYYTGTDLNTFYEKYSSRISYLHYRDVTNGKFIELGNGELDFASFINLTHKHGFSGWNMIEMELGDSYGGTYRTAEEVVATSLRHMKKNLAG